MNVDTNRDVIGVRRSDRDLINEAADIIAAAFHPLPPARWLIPDDTARARIFPDYFRMFVDVAAAHGRVHLDSTRSAVCVWFVNTLAPAPPPRDYHNRLELLVGEEHLPRFMAFDALLDRAHPSAPHEHLAFAATRPDRQKAGHLDRILGRHLDYLDKHRIAAYAEAATPDVRDTLARRQFMRMGEPIHLPDGGPDMWPMWRWDNNRTVPVGSTT